MLERLMISVSTSLSHRQHLVMETADTETLSYPDSSKLKLDLEFKKNQQQWSVVVYACNPSI